MYYLVEQGKNNIAFTCLFELGAMEEAIDLLIKTDRIPEAAMLARTYAPEHISKTVQLWKAGLENKNRKKTAESLADPAEYPNLFPELANKMALVEVEEEPLVDASEEDEKPLVDASEEDVEPLVDASEEEEEPLVDASEEHEEPSLI